MGGKREEKRPMCLEERKRMKVVDEFREYTCVCAVELVGQEQQVEGIEL